jgi:hypothetical protein
MGQWSLRDRLVSAVWRFFFKGLLISLLDVSQGLPRNNEEK